MAIHAIRALVWQNFTTRYCDVSPSVGVLLTFACRSSVATPVKTSRNRWRFVAGRVSADASQPRYMALLQQRSVLPRRHGTWQPQPPPRDTNFLTALRAGNNDGRLILNELRCHGTNANRIGEPMRCMAKRLARRETARHSSRLSATSFLHACVVVDRAVAFAELSFALSATCSAKHRVSPCGNDRRPHGPWLGKYERRMGRLRHATQEWQVRGPRG
jgi:hypothetical protein